MNKSNEKHLSFCQCKPNNGFLKATSAIKYNPIITSEPIKAKTMIFSKKLQQQKEYKSHFATTFSEVNPKFTSSFLMTPTDPNHLISTGMNSRPSKTLKRLNSPNSREEENLSLYQSVYSSENRGGARGDSWNRAHSKDMHRLISKGNKDMSSQLYSIPSHTSISGKSKQTDTNNNSFTQSRWRNRTSKSKRVPDWKLNKNERMRNLYEIFVKQLGKNGCADMEDFEANSSIQEDNHSVLKPAPTKEQETLFVNCGEAKEEQFPAKLLFMNYHRQELIKKFINTQKSIDHDALKRYNKFVKKYKLSSKYVSAMDKKSKQNTLKIKEQIKNEFEKQ